METDSVKIRKLKDETETERQDIIAVEKRFCICAGGWKEFYVSCTPSHLEELVLGHLFSRGELREAAQIASMEISEEKGEINVQILPTSTEKKVQTDKNTDVAFTLEKNVIFQTAAELFENPSEFFKETGCVHSCTLMIDGKIMCTMEDIGRHNALDKVIGYGLKHNLSFENAVIFVSGRISGDYLLKAVQAGIGMVVSRAAVTGEAVALAKKEQVTLLGFVRNNSGNVYHEGRISLL